MFTVSTFTERRAPVAGLCEVCRNILILDVATFDLARFCSENKKEKKVNRRRTTQFCLT